MNNKKVKVLFITAGICLVFSACAKSADSVKNQTNQEQTNQEQANQEQTNQEQTNLNQGNQTSLNQGAQASQNQEDQGNQVNSNQTNSNQTNSNEQNPATSNELPATSNELPATSNELPATSNELPAVSKEIPIKSDEISDPKVIVNPEDIVLKDGLKDESLTAVGEDYPDAGNLLMNVKGEENQILVCKDPVYDIVYYVNYGKDNYIYRIKDGKSELAVEIPAARLFCHQGELYFLAKEYGSCFVDPLKDGYILKYSPLTGKVSVVVAKQAATMFTYEDGIYYKVITQVTNRGDGTYTEERSYYHMPYETGMEERIDKYYISLYRWNQLFFTHEVEKVPEKEDVYRAVAVKFESLDQSESMMVSKDWMMQNYSVTDHQLFYQQIDSNVFRILDLNTKEVQQYQLPGQHINDYLVFDGAVYILSTGKVKLDDPYATGFLTRIDLNSHKMNPISENFDTSFQELNTDGASMYIIRTGGDHTTMEQLKINAQYTDYEIKPIGEE